MIKTGYVTIFESKDKKYEYPSGIVHDTADKALKALNNKPKGTPLFVAQITWDDEKRIS